jgi:hypothetical protein
MVTGDHDLHRAGVGHARTPLNVPFHGHHLAIGTARERQDCQRQERSNHGMNRLKLTLEPRSGLLGFEGVRPLAINALKRARAFPSRRKSKHHWGAAVRA